MSPDINFKKDNNIYPKSLRIAPKAEERQTGKANPYAYEFSYKGKKFDVLSTANGWWGKEDGKVKLHKLVTAYEFYFTDDQACSYAEISSEQLQYFQELHPDFYRIKHAAKQSPNQIAKKKIVGELDKDKELSKWWLEKTEKETFSPRIEATVANGRDLVDGLTQQVRQMGENLRAELINNKNNEKHTSGSPTGDINAEQVRDGNEAKFADNDAGGEKAST